MGSKGKVYIPDGTGTSVTAEWLAVATSIYSRINNYVATTAERNTLSASMTTAERLGARMWVDERKGWCTYDGTQWLWEPQRNVIIRHTTGALDIFNTVGDTTGAGNVVATTPNVTLPPGQRLLELCVAVQATAISSGTSWRARASIDGASLTSSIIGQTKIDALNQEDVFSRTFKIARSGNAVYTLRGINVDAAGWIRFQNVDITVTDLGPYDGVVTF